MKYWQLFSNDWTQCGRSQRLWAHCCYYSSQQLLCKREKRRGRSYVNEGVQRGLESSAKWCRRLWRLKSLRHMHTLDFFSQPFLSLKVETPFIYFFLSFGGIPRKTSAKNSNHHNDECWHPRGTAGTFWQINAFNSAYWTPIPDMLTDKKGWKHLELNKYANTQLQSKCIQICLILPVGVRGGQFPACKAALMKYRVGFKCSDIIQGCANVVGY